MGPGGDQTRDPWICSQTRICRQTRYQLRYAARSATLRSKKLYDKKNNNKTLKTFIADNFEGYLL